MSRAALVPAAMLMAAASAPTGVTAPGTVQGQVVLLPPKAGQVPACTLHATIDPNGAAFDNLGPTPALYRRTTAGGTVALSLPRVAHGTISTTGTTTVAAYDYLSIGTASLGFTTPTSGSVTFIGGGNTLPNPKFTAIFGSYTETWNARTRQLHVHANFILGGCHLPIIGWFQF